MNTIIEKIFDILFQQMNNLFYQIGYFGGIKCSASDFVI
jgi:hypothetical protein